MNKYCTSHRQYFEHNLINRSIVRKKTIACIFLDTSGRTYDPTISRFTSADIFIQAPSNSQSFIDMPTMIFLQNITSTVPNLKKQSSLLFLNDFHVINNPMKYTDPTGYEYDSVDSPNSSDSVGGDQEGADYASDHYSNDGGWDLNGDGGFRSKEQIKHTEAEVKIRQKEIQNIYRNYEQNTLKEKIQGARTTVLVKIFKGAIPGVVTLNPALAFKGAVTDGSKSLLNNPDALNMKFEIKEAKDKYNEIKEEINKNTLEDLINGLSQGSYYRRGY